MAKSRYQNGMIYRLVNDVDDEEYIGSTCMPLSKRKAVHKSSAKTMTTPVYVHLNSIGWSSVKIILLEKYPCSEKCYLLMRERYWIEERKPSLNRLTPISLCPHDKLSRHCAECIEARKVQRPVIPRCLCEHGNSNKLKCPECVAMTREKITCGCGTLTQRRNVKQHLNSKKHKRWEAAQEEKKEPEPEPEPEHDPTKHPMPEGECYNCSYLKMTGKADFCSEHERATDDERCDRCNKREDNCSCF